MTAELDLSTVLKELKDFVPEIESRIVLNQRRRLERIIREFEVSIGNYLLKFDQADVKSCLVAVREGKQFLPDHLENQAIKFFKRLFTVGEIACLFGCTEDNIHNRYRHHVKMEERAEEERSRSLGIPNLPSSMRNKAPEDITDEEAAQVAKLILIRRVMEHDDLDAASKLIGIFNQSVKSDSLRKWQQVKIMDEFYMSKLLPALQRHFATAGINVDVKLIIKKILGELSDEMKGKVKEAVSESQELNDLVSKAKRQGEICKKKELSIPREASAATKTYCES